MNRIITLLCLIVSSIAMAADPTTGQFLFQKKPASGPFLPFGITPENGKAFGIDVSGNPAMLSISGGVAWGSITGTLSSQTDLNTALNGKQPLIGIQNANKVFAGPATGSAATPTFRSLVSADLPSGLNASHLRTGTTNGDTATIDVWDTHDAIYRNILTATAGDSPTVAFGGDFIGQLTQSLGLLIGTDVQQYSDILQDISESISFPPSDGIVTTSGGAFSIVPLGPNTFYARASSGDAQLYSISDLGLSFIGETTQMGARNDIGLGYEDGPHFSQLFIGDTGDPGILTIFGASNAASFAEGVTALSGNRTYNLTNHSGYLGIFAATTGYPSLSSEVTGTLPVGGGGTGATSIGTSLTNSGSVLNTIQDIRTSASPLFAGFKVLAGGTATMVVESNSGPSSASSRYIASAQDFYFGIGPGDATGDLNVYDGIMGTIPLKLKMTTGFLALGGASADERLSLTGNVKISGYLVLPKTITATATTGAQTINKTAGSVNFATAATSLVVTNSLAIAPTSGSTGSIIMATVRTDDASMKSVVVVCSSNGAFTLVPNSAPAGTVRVDFFIVTP